MINSLEIKLLASLQDINPVDWNRLCPDRYPFICWEFLNALESTGCVAPDTGWQAQHLLVFNDTELLALMPMYLKGHSRGEYVFDHAWASAYARHGLPYYPKFLSAIPFTPCEGPRLCFSESLEKLGIDKHELFTGIVNTLAELAREYKVSSWHCLFPERDSLEFFKHQDILLREDVQFQWFNKGYQSFEDFLSGFTSKRRKNLKRERRRVAEQAIEIRRLRGDEISTDTWEVFFRFYQATYWKRGMPEYLNLEFFLELGRTMPERLLLVLAERDGSPVAAALSIVGDDTLYGRYWGCLEEYQDLHFELCYYQGIEFCIEQGLRCFNSGAQGEHKIARGFEPVKTYSLHWIAHDGFRDAIADFLQEENQYVSRYRDATGELLPFNSNFQAKQSHDK